MTDQLPFNLNPEKQVIIFIGIQASGKSTFYEKMLATHGYTHINLDTLHTRDLERWAIDECYARNLSFVVDNTNPLQTDRQRYIPDAKAHNYEVIGIYFQGILKDCIARNGQRDRQVPAHVIAHTQKKLQLPQYSEGFDKIYYVRISDNGYEITEWKELKL